MWFEIPEEHRELPEARRVLELDAEFRQVIQQQREANAAAERDASVVESLAKNCRDVQRALDEAVAAYDLATGEPKPVDLPPDVVQFIDGTFANGDRGEVIAKLSKMLGYLDRQGRGECYDIARRVLILAKGNKTAVAEYAEAAIADWRNIIYWTSHANVSRLDSPGKIEDFQQTLEWLGLPRDAELDAEQQQRVIATSEVPAKKMSWWRFW